MPAAFVLLYNVTLLKDFYNSRLINFSTAYTRHPSVSPHPLCQSSSPFVKLQSPYTWQYRLQHQSVGTKGWAERWGEGEETCDKTRWIERRREKESVLPRTCQPFYYHDVCAFITVPANKNLLKPMGRQLCWDLVECERAWTVHWSVRHLSFTCVGCREGHWKMCRGQWSVRLICSRRDLWTGRRLEDIAGTWLTLHCEELCSRHRLMLCRSKTIVPLD